MVEDIDGEVILYNDSFMLCQQYAEEEHNVTLSVLCAPQLLHFGHL